MGHLSTSFLWLQTEDQNFCAFVGDCGLQFAAKLGIECDGALVDVLPVVALSRLHVDHRSQYSSVSKRKVQLNLGTPLHRISIGILFLTQFSPSGLSNGFPPGFPGFPGLLGFPPGFFALISGARLRPMKKSGTQAQPSPITVTLSPAWL